MIEISHQQARRWIREHMDQRLPDGQWAALQAHLETCRECHTYLIQLEGVEKNIHRALRAGMEALPLASEALPQQVIVDQQARAVARKRVTVTSLGLLALAVFFLLGGFSGITRLLSPVSDVTPALPEGSLAGQPAGVPVAGGLEVTPMPTAGPGDFPAVVVYEGRQNNQASGKRQIYLLNPGSAPVTLGDAQANDFSPAWSPDGEWLAFLSDRTGKPEVFVTNVAGNQVVQLTDNPGVAWDSPLSWSADGQWLALSGVRDAQGGQRWVYLVGLDGTGARSLPGSRGGSLPKFAPYGDRLAYVFSDGTNGGITINHIETGQYASTSWVENPLAPPLAEGSALDWSNDGSEIVFIAPQPVEVATTKGVPPEHPSVGSQVMAIRDLNDTISLYVDYAYNYRAAESRWPGAFRGASWTANGSILFLEDLGDARANDKPGQRPGGCWTLQAHTPATRGREARTVTLSDLCIEGGLDRGSWTPDGRWMVVSGRMPGESTRSLYAVRMPGRGFRSSGQPTPTPLPTLPASGGAGARTGAAVFDGPVLRLADAPWLGDLPRVRPRLRSYNSPMEIVPQPIQPARTELKPSNLAQRAGGPSGQIVYVVQNNATSVVVRANPDGTGGKVLAVTPTKNQCPRWSPDGKSIALVSQQGSLAAAVGGGGKLERPMPVQTAMNSASSLGEAIFLMDENGGSVRQLTRSSSPNSLPNGLEDIGTLRVYYDCPVWSPEAAPGGPYIAVIANRGGNWYLLVIRVDANPEDPGAVRYVQIGHPAEWTRPTWAPDGRSLYVALNIDSGSMIRLLHVSLPPDEQTRLNSDVIYERSSASFGGLAVTPDNQQIFTLTQAKTGSSVPLTRLLSLDLRYNAERISSTLGKDDPRNPILGGALASLGRNSLGFILRGGPEDPHQAAIFQYDLRRGRFSILARVEDVLSEAAWSPDGRYVVYSTESGLWGLDIEAARQGAASPVWLSPQPVQDIDWR